MYYAPGGVLIFKWNEVHIPTRDIIKLSPVPPIFGHPSGKRANTNWVCFQKPGENLMAQLEAAEAQIKDMKEVLRGIHNTAIDPYGSRAGIAIAAKRAVLGDTYAE